MQLATLISSFLLFAISAHGERKILCENQRGKIECKNNRIIHIEEAVYGRQTKDFCNGAQVNTLNCRASDSTAIIKRECEGKFSCELYASNTEFGDPCPYTNKYLLVIYQCVSESGQYKFQCKNGQLISPNLVCNRNNDCADGSDESSCTFESTSTHLEPSTTPASIPFKRLFRCTNGKLVNQNLVCNGNSDCQDNSDESRCAFSGSGQYQFQCNNGQLISPNLVCNWNKDCADGSDESPCTYESFSANSRPSTTPFPFNRLFRCTNGKFVNQNLVCNGNNDCQDNSDESRCAFSGSGQYQFQCNNGQLISPNLVCNFNKDCADGSDESPCSYGSISANSRPSTTPAPVSGKRLFRCTNGQRINQNLVCNGNNDCQDNSDESRCAFSGSGQYQFQCNNGQLINRNLVCNGRKDCSDGADEQYCDDSYPTDINLKYKCKNGFFIDQNLVCNGVTDCPDGDDEICYSSFSTKKTPSGTQKEYRCNDGTLINPNLVCDGNKDCPDGGDETNCSF